MVVYPHYFSGAEVPGFGVKAAKLPFDPRWTLFFTPHSAHLDPALIKQARSSLWWDDSPALRRPQDIRAGARRAREAGVTGYVPSLEAFTFVATEAEEGQAWLKGKRQVPLGFGWLEPRRAALRRVADAGQPDRLPGVQPQPRPAVRSVQGDPGPGGLRGEADPQAVDDVLELQAAFAFERTWCQPSPLVSPERVRAMKDRGDLTPKKRAEYRAALDRLRAIEGRHRGRSRTASGNSTASPGGCSTGGRGGPAGCSTPRRDPADGHPGGPG